MLQDEELLRMFEASGAIRHGHFELSSGLHSGAYVQCALVLAISPLRGKTGARASGAFLRRHHRSGCIAGARRHRYRTGSGARLCLNQKSGAGGGVPAIFAERDSGGMMCLRRGFTLRPDQHVLVIEDVWTTGGSTLETIQVVEEAGGRVVAAGALIDRSGGKIEFPVEASALLDLPIASYEAVRFARCAAMAAPQSSQ